MKKRLFISQPMNGRTDKEIQQERNEIIARVIDKFPDDEVEVIDSFFKDAPHEAKPLWFLGKSLELLSTADIAFFARGFENARGCKIENQCAIQYNIETVIEDYTDGLHTFKTTKEAS